MVTAPDSSSTMKAHYCASDGFTETVESDEPATIAAFYRKWVGSSDDGVSGDGVGHVSLEGITIAEIDRLCPKLYTDYQWNVADRDAAINRIKAQGYDVISVASYRTGSMSWGDEPGWRIEFTKGKNADKAGAAS